MSIQELATRFPIPGVRFDEGRGGLHRIAIATAVSTGEIYLHGAHVTQFQPAGHAPVLWMSNESLYEADKPIRGGVPICFPWFGPHPSDPKLPSHGWARLAEWELVGCGLTADGGVSVDLQTNISDFVCNYRVEFAQSLRMNLSVQLTPGTIAKRRFEEALHTYLSIGDIHQISIHGLESTPYLDKVGSLVERDATRKAIAFEEETDRVYSDTTATCLLRDPTLNRTIAVKKIGSQSTVVWNPWIEKSRKMSDFGDQEWPSMVCIESANVGHNAFEIAPSQIHSLKTEIEVISL